MTINKKSGCIGLFIITIIVRIGISILLLLQYRFPQKEISQINENLPKKIIITTIRETSGNITTPATTSPKIPLRIKIPSIQVDAAIEGLGLTSGGKVDAPKGPATAGWFNLGPRPGQTGSAIIVGHYGRWKIGRGSVFDNLHKLQKGDQIFIENDTGTSISFRVTNSKEYDPNADASAIFNSTDGKAHLNLITCEGTRDNSTQSYSKRLVIFSDKE